MSVLVSDMFLFSFSLKYEFQLRNRDNPRRILELVSAVDKLECGFDGEEQGRPAGHSRSLRDSHYSHEPRSGSAVFRAMRGHSGESPGMCSSVRPPADSWGNAALRRPSRRCKRYGASGELCFDGAVRKALAVGIGAGCAGQCMGHPIATGRLDAVTRPRGAPLSDSINRR